MTYKFGWEATPEIKVMYQHSIEMFKRREAEQLRNQRKEKIVLGIAVFFWAIALFLPLVARVI